MTSSTPTAQFPSLCKRLPNVCTALVLISCSDFTNLSSPRSLTINAQWTSQPTYIPIFKKSLSLSFSSHPVNGCIWNLYLDQWTHHLWWLFIHIWETKYALQPCNAHIHPILFIPLLSGCKPSNNFIDSGNNFMMSK